MIDWLMEENLLLHSPFHHKFVQTKSEVYIAETSKPTLLCKHWLAVEIFSSRVVLLP